MASYNDTVHHIPTQHFHIAFFLFRVEKGIAEHQLIAVAVGRVLDAGSQLGVKLVGQRRQDKADDLGTLFSQGTRHLVGVVIAWKTAFRVASLMAPRLLSTLDTVAMETPAFDATSLMVDTVVDLL